jgi:hypothetical protein
MAAKSLLMGTGGKTTDGQIVLMVTSSVVFHGATRGYVFQPGQVWVFAREADIPKGLRAVSEPYAGGALPHDHRVFDPEDYRKAMAPRPEPPQERTLREADVMARFGWSKAQFSAARAQGFPAPDRRFQKAGPHGFEHIPGWTETCLQQWEAVVKSLNLR